MKEHETGRQIQRATNSISNRFRLQNGTSAVVDGFDCDRGIVYEFHGCDFHGFSTCFNLDQQHKTQDISYRELWQDTQARTKALKELNIEVVEMSECEFNFIKKNFTDVAAFVKHLDLVTPFDPREAFF